MTPTTEQLVREAAKNIASHVYTSILDYGSLDFNADEQADFDGLVAVIADNFLRDLVQKSESAQLAAANEEVKRLREERDHLLKDLTRIAAGCGVGCPDREEAIRRIVAIKSELTTLTAAAEQAKGALEWARTACLEERKAEDDRRSEHGAFPAEWPAATQYDSALAALSAALEKKEGV